MSGERGADRVAGCATDSTLRRALTAVLESGGIEDAALEAQWILEDAADEAQAREIARRRAAHEPLQYLLGKWEFYGMPVLVGKGVLIPRADTETLVEAVLSRIPDAPAQQIADLCTGSGCIALALAKHLPQTAVSGLDISKEALAYAEKNRALNTLRNVRFLHADVTQAGTAAQFSGLAAVVSNPPYLTAEDMQQLQEEVRHEPALALAGGEDGLDFYRVLTGQWRGALAPGGLLAFETGIGQAAQVAQILAENGFEAREILPDTAGIPRVVLGRRAER